MMMIPWGGDDSSNDDADADDDEDFLTFNTAVR